MMTVPETTQKQPQRESFIMSGHRQLFFTSLLSLMLFPTVGCSTGEHLVQHPLADHDEQIYPDAPSRVRFMLDVSGLLGDSNRRTGPSTADGEAFWVIYDAVTKEPLLELDDDGTGVLTLESLDGALWVDVDSHSTRGFNARTTAEQDTDEDSSSSDMRLDYEFDRNVDSLIDGEFADSDVDGWPTSWTTLAADDDDVSEESTLYLGEMRDTFFIEFVDCSSGTGENCDNVRVYVDSLNMLRTLKSNPTGTWVNSAAMANLSDLFLITDENFAHEQGPTRHLTDPDPDPGEGEGEEGGEGEETYEDGAQTQKERGPDCAWPEGDPTPYVRAKLFTKRTYSMLVCSVELIRQNEVESAAGLSSFETVVYNQKRDKKPLVKSSSE